MNLTQAITTLRTIAARNGGHINARESSTLAYAADVLDRLQSIVDEMPIEGITVNGEPFTPGTGRPT